ncbi:MAG: phosphatidylinositol mannoside acyltransferase [Acidimicrobiia bacterium]
MPHSFSELASVLLYRTGAGLAQLLPAAAGEPGARALSRVIARATPQRRAQVERNLSRVSGGRLDGLALRRAVSDTFDSYGRYWWELFRLPVDVATRDLSTRFELEGGEHFLDGVAAGKGVVVALPHVGGWDFAGAWFAERGFRPVAVAEPVEPPELFDWFADIRQRAGIDIVPLGPNVGNALLAALRAGRVVTLLCDRDIPGNGVEVEFFSERTTMPSGPALLALRTGAALLPAAVYFSPRGKHRAVVQAPVEAARQGRLRDDVRRVTELLAGRLEELIRAAPEQWHLMQPNWPSDRNGQY